ncbi:MAG: hypothetical protein AAF193_06915 [Bacteroidota bacterium]
MRKLSVIGLVLILSACQYNVASEQEPEGCEIPEVPTYSADIKQIIDTRCATPICHTPAGDAPGDFTNYEGMESYLNSGFFATRVLEDMDMPPSSSLGDCDLEKIETWINQGAQE